MPRYVILRHETSQGVHLDFMLEANGVLKTWSLAEPPRPGVEIECKALPDHRLAYLDYEGPISGGRGTVARWDRGTYVIRRQSDVEWAVELASERFVCEAIVRRDLNEPNRWRLSLTEADQQLANRR
jgi:hypothetical protein